MNFYESFIQKCFSFFESIFFDKVICFIYTFCTHILKKFQKSIPSVYHFWFLAKNVYGTCDEEYILPVADMETSFATPNFGLGHGCKKNIKKIIGGA